MPRERDRRLETRVPEQAVQAEYVVSPVLVRDLSVGGLSLLDPNPHQRGESVELVVRMPEGDPIRVRAMVRRVDAGVGMALEFIHIEPADRRRLKEHIARTSPEKISGPGDDIFA